MFVASPSDVVAERERLQNVIDEINLTRSRELGIRLELTKWETHALPGFGADPQDVINDAIPQDYDIFIGIMWQRFGTPTLRAPSGTLEEFQTAKLRFDEDPDSVRIMVYFKDAPIAPSKIDATQIKAISDFRATLGPQGGLYWVFEDTDQFERLARIHLQKAIQDWRDKGFVPLGVQSLLAVKEPMVTETDEPGILDLTIELTERFAEAGTKMADSNAVMNHATQRLNGLGAELSKQGSIVTPSNMKQIKKLTSDVATALAEFDRDFYQAASAAADNVEGGIDAMIKLIELQTTVNPEEEEGAIGLVQVIDNVQNNIERYRDEIARARAGLDLMPPISKETNKAKRSLLQTLSKVIERQDRSIGLIKELKQTIFSLIRNSAERLV